MKNKAQIGIIGGSGFYDLVSNLVEVNITTPYGLPSEKIALGEIAGKQIAFLPRHGKNHHLPPHLINYRANIWALKSLGVDSILTSVAVGSLQPNYCPGDLVILDQFVDRTKNRVETFYDGPEVIHISTAFPYCPALRELAITKAKKLAFKVHPAGTVVVVQGPRFSTAAESSWFTNLGWQTINMTQYPEIVLAREKEMCYCAVAVVTDYDSGLVTDGKIKPVSAKEVAKIFKANMGKVKDLFLDMIQDWPSRDECDCKSILKQARF